MADEGSGRVGENQTPSEAELERRWEAADEDPDLEEDLGYEAVDLDVLVTSNRDKKVMVLPSSMEEIRDDAYIIADLKLTSDPVEQA